MAYIPRTFVVSDTHFGHRKMTAMDGDTRIRPWATIEEHDHEIVKRWNTVVNPKDTVYHLGDVCINRSALAVCSLLNGRKILVKGNHDEFRIDEYLSFFTDIKGAVEYSQCILTHIPVHPSQLNRWMGNVHGHLHAARVTDQFGMPDLRYRCVSLEQVDYQPILLSQVIYDLEHI